MYMYLEAKRMGIGTLVLLKIYENVLLSIKRTNRDLEAIEDRLNLYITKRARTSKTLINVKSILNRDRVNDI